MAFRAVATDVSVGPVRIRLEILPIVAGIWLIVGAGRAIAFLAAVLVHELGHFVVARAAGLSPERVILQVTGGGPYLREAPSARARISVLLGGPIASLLLALGALTAGALGAGSFATELYMVSLIWTIYQLTPFPPLDGGQLLRIALSGRVKSATLTWRLGWVLGLGLAVAFVLADPRALEPVVLLGGMAILLGRGEAGYVRHLDAYSAWERGDHRAVLARALRLPEYLEPADKLQLRQLGLLSAIELGDVEVIGQLTDELPACHAAVLAAGEWLLARDHDSGARLAQRALDALDAERVSPGPAERQRLADLCVSFAAREARCLRYDSALGLLERAVDLGYQHAARLEVDGDLRPLASSPRFTRVLAASGGGGPDATA